MSSTAVAEKKKTEEPKEEEKKEKEKVVWTWRHKVVIAACYIGMMACEAGECSLDVALPNAVADPMSVLTDATTGRLLALGVAAYGVGKTSHGR